MIYFESVSDRGGDTLGTNQLLVPLWPHPCLWLCKQSSAFESFSSTHQLDCPIWLVAFKTGDQYPMDWKHRTENLEIWVKRSTLGRFTCFMWSYKKIRQCLHNPNTPWDISSAQLRQIVCYTTNEQWHGYKKRLDSALGIFRADYVDPSQIFIIRMEPQIFIYLHVLLTFVILYILVSPYSGY